MKKIYLFCFGLLSTVFVQAVFKNLFSKFIVENSTAICLCTKEQSDFCKVNTFCAYIFLSQEAWQSKESFRWNNDDAFCGKEYQVRRLKLFHRAVALYKKCDFKIKEQRPGYIMCRMSPPKK